MSIKTLDHFAHNVPELDVATEVYTKLGFHVRPRALHIELGSSNSVIHFEKTYYELIDLTHGTDWLVAPYRAKLDFGSGMCHVSLDSSDLEADRERLKGLGHNPLKVVSARRKITLPTGEPTETQSSCFYNWRDDNPYLSLFYSIHEKPETIFIPEYVNHENGALDISKIVFCTTTLKADIDYFTDSLEKAPDQQDSDSFTMTGSRGEVTEVMTQKAFEKSYGEFAYAKLEPLAGLPKLMTLHVRDISQTKSYFQRKSIPFLETENGIGIHEDHTLGIGILFEQRPGS